MPRLAAVPRPTDVPWPSSLSAAAAGALRCGASSSAARGGRAETLASLGGGGGGGGGEACSAAEAAGAAASLRVLVRHDGGPRLQAALEGVSATTLLGALLPCLGGIEGSLLTETEALTALVRLLGPSFGDPLGDDLAFEHGAQHAPQPAPEDAAQSAVLGAAASEQAAMAVVDLLRRRGPEFQRGEAAHLRLEALRALRLQLAAASRLGGARVWWGEEDIGHVTRGPTRRQLVDILLAILQSVSAGGAHMGHRPKVAALACLWTIVANSAACRTAVIQQGGAALVVEVLRAQARERGLPAEAPLLAACGLLTALAVGPRLHERTLATLGADAEAASLLTSCLQHQRVAVAAALLLGVVCRDASAAARLAASPQTLAALVAVRERWPLALGEAVGSSAQPLAPFLHALLEQQYTPNSIQLAAAAGGIVSAPACPPPAPRSARRPSGALRAGGDLMAARPPAASAASAANAAKAARG